MRRGKPRIPPPAGLAEASGAGRRVFAEKRELEVLVLIDHLALGGAEILVSQFAAVAPVAGIRLEVTCLTDGDGNPAAQPLRAAGIEPVVLHVPERLGPGALHRVRRHLAATRPDIVHTHLGTSDVLGSIAARSLGLHAVSTIHAMAWKRGGQARARLALAATARRHGAARIIAVSNSARNEYLARGWSPSHHVVTIHNGIDVERQPGAGAAVRRDLGLDRDDLVLGMVSALRPEKGHDAAIEAVALLRARFPQLRLLIVGEGHAGSDIRRLANALGDTVVMPGSRSDVMQIFDAIDICLHPSRADAFPTTLLEAMAASVPIVATSVGGIPEIVADGHTGVLVPSPPTADRLALAVAGLLEDPSRRHTLAEAARQRYESRFRAGPWAHRIRALYESVLSERRTRGGDTSSQRP
jgi:glycosyltransferase involved in cell wall biosynthesis